MKRILFVILVLLVNSFSYGQTALDIINSAKKALEGNYSIDVSYSSKFLKDGKEEEDILETEYCQFQNGFFQNLGSSILIKEDSILLTIDHEDRVISMGYHFDRVGMLDLVDLDIFDNEYFDIVVNEDELYHSISILAKGEYNPIKSMTMLYSRDTYIPVKLTMLYHESAIELHGSNQLDIIYSNYKKIENRSANQEIEKYVVHEGSNFTLKSLVSDYFKINNL